MSKAVVVYDSKYGNTRQAAETIAEGMREVPEIEVWMAEFREVDFTAIGEFDAIIIGSPNHFGRATRSINKFIDKIGKLDIENKWVAVFDTHIASWEKDFEKAVKKMEKQIDEKVPGMKLAAPGLSVKVVATKGPVADGELLKCREFGVKIANIAKGQV